MAPHSEEIWRTISTGGARMVKAHYALWARWYDSQDPAGWVLLSINQFCADLGYAKHHRGGYKPEQKREARELLNAMTGLELLAQREAKGKALRIKGPLWMRGLVAEERDLYGDLLGNAREGDPALWEPVAYSYRPGEWFDAPEWKANMQAVGKAAVGLLNLRHDKESTALLVGGYLCTLIRANQYRPSRVRVKTLLDRSGAGPKTQEDQYRVTRYQGALEGALAKLQEVGVIAGWQYSDSDESELDDPDNPAAIAAYYDEGNLSAPRSYYKRVVEITWPAWSEADGKRLEDAQAKRIQAMKRRRSGTTRRPKTDV